MHSLVEIVNSQAGRKVLGYNDWTAIDDNGSTAVIAKAFPTTPEHRITAAQKEFVEPRVIKYDPSKYLFGDKPYTEILKEQLSEKMRAERSNTMNNESPIDNLSRLNFHGPLSGRKGSALPRTEITEADFEAMINGAFSGLLSNELRVDQPIQSSVRPLPREIFLGHLDPVTSMLRRLKN
jgi:hypothetical protein